jgi:hypothetical protein
VFAPSSPGINSAKNVLLRERVASTFRATACAKRSLAYLVRKNTMVGSYAQLGDITEEQYRGLDEMLNSSGISTTGLVSHTAFREGAQLSVFDVWESREAMDAFWAAASDVLQGTGATIPEGTVMDIVNNRIY